MRLNGDITSEGKPQPGAHCSFLLAAFGAYLSRISGVDAFDVGYSPAGLQREVSGLGGLYPACVAVRFAVDGLQPFSSLLSDVQEQMEAVHRRRTFAADVWARCPSLRASDVAPARGALPVVVEIVDSLEASIAIPGAVLALRISQARSECRLDFNRRAIHDTEAQRIAEQFEVFLAGIEARPNCPVGSLPLMTDAELRKVLVEWNQTEASSLQDETIHSSFDHQVQHNPEAPALTVGDETWSYRQLAARAQEISHRLQAAGAGSETIVALCVERSLNMVAGMLGILKSGAAYLPIDSTYPMERISEMVEDAQPIAVLTSSSMSNALAGISAPLVRIDASDVPSPSDIPAIAQASAGTGDGLAYVIYTSGSTGKPKGVMVEHRNAMNFFAALDRLFGREPGVVLGVTSVSFDPSVHEILWSLTRGYHVVLWQGMERGGDATIPALIRRHRVTLMLGVPSLYRMILDMPGGREALTSVRHLVVGGEPLTGELLTALGEPVASRMVNMYGPTETTVAATAWCVEPSAATIPIGRPLSNTRLYVLDRRLQPVPPGVAGELFIGGAGVARGYLHRPQLTGERFIKSPFNSNGERLYRTGDLVRWRQDGNLDYIGRADGQVKIRGHRVEIGEVEARLCRHPSVRAGVVDVQAGEKGDKRLVAYVVPAATAAPTTGDLREWMCRALPDYMVPALFISIESLPLTANGKVDRRALPKPDLERTQLTGAYVAPRTATEDQLTKIWAQALGVERVGINDNFFELGGHSLVAARVLVENQKVFGVGLTLKSLFESPTIAQFARAVEGAVANANNPQTPVIQRIVRQARSRVTHMMAASSEMLTTSTEMLVSCGV